MKKSTIRPVLFTLLIVASLCAYVFVNYDAFSGNYETVPATSNHIDSDSTFNDLEDPHFLLEIELLKKLIEASADRLPTVTGI